MSMIRHFLGGAAAVLTASLTLSLAVPAQAKTLGTNQQPITNAAGTSFGVLSHRGGALQWPENSVQAYTNSVAAGFDAIETDILFTSENQPVMSHYDLLPERCTQTGQSIHLMTAAQVAEVRCADLSGNKTVPIPTFAQLVEALAGHPEVGLFLDIKTYPGQPAADKARYAAQAIQLVKDAGLLARTSIISFSWPDHLRAIRAAAPNIYVFALDTGQMDLDRVRLADKLGASGYGIKMKYTSEYLATYTKAKGMDAVPWEVLGDEQLSFWIHYGGKSILLSTDAPSQTRTALVNGTINLNPTPTAITTTLTAPVALSKATYKANQRRYLKVVDVAVPKAEVAQLRNVTLTVKVQGGKGKGKVSIGGSSTPLSSSTTVKIPKKTKTFTLTTVLGDKGKIRVYATKTVKLTITALAYTRVRFA